MRLNKIDETQETIVSLLQEREGAVGPLPVAPTPQQPDIIMNIKNQLPITTDEKMDIVEDELSTKEKMEEMARYLSSSGGNTIPEIVRRILKSTMSDHFAANYSWIGFKKKKVFSSLHLKEAIFSGVRRNSRTSSASDAEIEDVIKTWVKYAKARFQAREKKGNSN
ncbi:uncharacterized protein LOC111043963 [Nilaparvata lugens]|uniref:uncharacterized protein LOC120354843 n=1 Tax=Nilaparvata lugens TaxID=108931 RepID=UPI00193E5465|nr:uncharacterized protein LOC120354843 [Nilaparvata lugens]XP_039298696.1 uncharacterized protein LOC120354843 [Nilaparvata lugens]XP_039298727.1 uncharacterized protein LOC111043963 [Nilaparvata lugens]XP_039298728.1 uncharacterized protein LOC111043963 [Nilaparvata lugens]XP_039298729.1 uncharacterized protein LOC111043963 [Nilaparvata lugens]